MERWLFGPKLNNIARRVIQSFKTSLRRRSRRRHNPQYSASGGEYLFCTIELIICQKAIHFPPCPGR